MNATQEQPSTLVERINFLREEMRNRRRRGEYCTAQGILKDGSDNKHIICNFPYIEKYCWHKCNQIRGVRSMHDLCNYRPTPFD
jgi:hypothetical protein